MSSYACRLITSIAGLPLLSVVASAPAKAQTPTQTAGDMREMVCRGKAGLEVRVDRDPSPRNDSLVSMVLKYQRNTKTLAMNYVSLDPGTCTWNAADLPNQPAEPGVVYFDVPREAQPWSGTGTRLIDTTVNAAEHFHDVRTIPRYLNDPSHYWVFYVDDATNVSSSFTSFLHPVTPPSLVAIDGALTSDAGRLAGTAELRCRGGTGLAFHRGGSAGTNLVTMTLAYPISRSAAGANSRGLAQGTCAWVDRSGIRTEPGRIRFVTAGNAQLRQAQSGTPVDRTPNAAERFPDVNTIPAYMRDPAHYWAFTVSGLRPDSASTHGAWKWSPTSAIAGPVSTASPIRSFPGSSVGGVRTPGTGTTAGTATVAKATARVDNVGLVLDRFTIRFSGRPGAAPSVLYGTQQPIRDPSGRWVFPSGGGAPAQVTGGTTSGLRATYVAWSSSPPARGQLYHYIITIPATAAGTEEQLTGQLTTLSQNVRVLVHRIDLAVVEDEDLGFNLYVTSPFASHGLAETGITGGPGIWKLGSHSVNGENSVANAADKLEVYVYGKRASLLNYYSNENELWVKLFHDDQTEGGIARGEFNIGTSPNERYFTIPFVIKSNAGHAPVYTAHGVIQVTRR